MPTYEYKCSNCGHKFEKYQSITAAPIKVCPSCGKRTAQRLIGTGAGVIFKGSGFYTTDYRSDSYKERAKSDKESAKPAAETSTAASGNGQSNKSDSAKPAASESKPAAEKPAAAPAAPAPPNKPKSSSAKRAR
jgi:putative FmdB family regulatory protein